jgi:hypothetical protein
MRLFRELFFGLVVLGCSRTPEEPIAPPTSSGAVAKQAVGNAAGASPSGPAAVSPPAARGGAGQDLVWKDPAGWQRAASGSAMRKATYKVPRLAKDPEDVEVAVFYFGANQGGGTEANIQRWISQFSDAKPSDVKRTVRTVAGMQQTIVEIEGTYASGMPGGEATPKGRFRLLGAVVESPGGSYFFKMTGPKDSVAAARDAFYGMLDSVRQG